MCKTNNIFETQARNKKPANEPTSHWSRASDTVRMMISDEIACTLVYCLHNLSMNIKLNAYKGRKQQKKIKCCSVSFIYMLYDDPRPIGHLL